MWDQEDRILISFFNRPVGSFCCNYLTTMILNPTTWPGEAKPSRTLVRAVVVVGFIIKIFKKIKRKFSRNTDFVPSKKRKSKLSS